MFKYPVLLQPPLGALILGLASFAVQAQTGSLYERLGGDSGVKVIASDLIDATRADPHSGRTLQEKVDIPRVKRLLAEQICMLAQGPCQYSGDNMRQVHAGMHISEAEFYRMVELLIDVLEKRGVGQRETNQLLALLAPMKRDIVEPRDAQK